MAKRCSLTGKGVLTGNNVSHAHNKTRRRFLPNLQVASIWSDSMEKSVRLRLSAYAMRLLEKKGGLDAYVLGTRNTQLPPEIRRLKKLIVRAVERKAAA
jgi:large subunit ribosomal protein L28